MKNRYPKECSICRGTVPAGEGILRQESDGWGVTHADRCPRTRSEDGEIRHGHARAYTRRIMAILRRPDATYDEVLEAVESLSALVQTQWTSTETCEKILLNSAALKSFDRCTVEGILNHLMLEDSHA